MLSIITSTSLGANFQEAQGAVSRPYFSNKIEISLKEMQESNYWIRMIITMTPNHQDWLTLKQKSFELMNIFGSIYSKTSIKR